MQILKNKRWFSLNISTLRKDSDLKNDFYLFLFLYSASSFFKFLLKNAEEKSKF